MMLISPGPDIADGEEEEGKCWQRATSHRITTPFDDLTEEISSGDVFKQST